MHWIVADDHVKRNKKVAAPSVDPPASSRTAEALKQAQGQNWHKGQPSNPKPVGAESFRAHAQARQDIRTPSASSTAAGAAEAGVRYDPVVEVSKDTTPFTTVVLMLQSSGENEGGASANTSEVPSKDFEERKAWQSRQAKVH